MDDYSKRVNEHAGKVLRARRNNMGKAQKLIAEKATITFQQLQKYEKGTNSMPFPRLCQLAETLGLSLGDFDPNTPAQNASLPMSLAKNFNKLTEEGQNSVMGLVRSLAKQQEAKNE